MEPGRLAKVHPGGGSLGGYDKLLPRGTPYDSGTWSYRWHHTVGGGNPEQLVITVHAYEAPSMVLELY